MLRRELKSPPRIALISETAWKSAIRRGEPAMADANLRLDRTRSVDDPNDAAHRAGGVHDRRLGRCIRSRAGPRPEEPIGEGDDVLAAKIAADDEGRPIWRDRPFVDTPEIARAEGLDGFADPARRSVVGRLRCVDGPDEGFLDASPWVGPGLEQVVQTLVAKTLDLGLREGRGQQDLGDQLERRSEPGGGHVHVDAQRVPTGIGVERGAETLGGLDQRDGVVALRPLRQGAGREHDRAALLWRLLGRPAGDDERRGDQRPPREVDHEDREPIREAMGGDRRKLVRPRRTGLRSLGDDDGVLAGLDGRAHAATSESPSASVASSVGSEMSSASKPSGR